MVACTHLVHGAVRADGPVHDGRHGHEEGQQQEGAKLVQAHRQGHTADDLQRGGDVEEGRQQGGDVDAELRELGGDARLGEAARHVGLGPSGILHNEEVRGWAW